FYGERSRAWEVLHNPVDVEAFAPAVARPRRPLTLLLGGNQYQRYRLERALETLSIVRREIADVRMVVAGSLSFAPDGPEQTAALVRALGVEEAVELVGPYTQLEAPALLHRADVLVHPKYNDPCPTVVLEAMACGLPVVYSSSGGTPELVGDDGGIGVDAPLDWDRDHPPSAVELAAAVVEIAGDLEARRAAARERALRFAAQPWVERHRAIFERLVL